MIHSGAAASCATVAFHSAVGVAFQPGRQKCRSRCTTGKPVSSPSCRANRISRHRRSRRRECGDVRAAWANRCGHRPSGRHHDTEALDARRQPSMRAQCHNPCGVDDTTGAAMELLERHDHVERTQPAARHHERIGLRGRCVGRDAELVEDLGRRRRLREPARNRALWRRHLEAVLLEKYLQAFGDGVRYAVATATRRAFTCLSPSTRPLL